MRLLFRALGPIAPGLVGRLAFRLFRTTQRYPIPRRERDWLAWAESVDLRLDGERIAGWSWGRGPTILLMHGWGGRGSQMGAFAYRLARAGYRVVALDAPGHGASGGRLSSLPQFAATVELVAERFGPLTAVVAHSFGAAGTGWAKAGGIDVGRLVFIAAPGDLDGYIDKFQELVGMSQKSREMMLATLGSRFDVPWSEARFATTLAADETPMLVVHDRDDDETPLAGAQAIARAWPNSRLVETTGLGHRRILRDPDVVAEVVEFLDAGCRQPEQSAVERSVSSR